MSRGFSFIDHTADIAIELKADSIEGLFIAAAEAFKEAVTDFTCSSPGGKFKIEITAMSEEELLVNFLNEINFYLITRKRLCCSIESIKIIKDKDLFKLDATLIGIQLNPEIILKNEIKAVTYHQMNIVKKQNFYETLVVFDI